ncbi:G5 and 3D domain-containing protein [Virgibacillus halodenitrificans]|uniref:G5 and 3D domain-containing protein n=1 Tax=Virgibacillus halodenitrificans TaxID=1482 RepID=UPI000EF4472D|nr:G5 and 3D domain-containing protein [Virgibacillus halodenitrificans]
MFRKKSSNLKVFCQLAAFMMLIGFNIHYYTQTAVALTIDGKEEMIRSHANTVGELLEEKEIDIEPQDNLKPSANTKIKNDMEVSLNKAKTVDIVVDGETKKVKSIKATVEEVLKEADIPVNKHDRIFPDKETEIQEGMIISVKKSTPLTIKNGGEKNKVWSHTKTVEYLLKEQEIKLSSLDKVKPSLEEIVENNMVVSVIRVEQKEKIVEEKTDFSVITKKDSSLEKGKEKIAQEGEKGMVKKKFLVTYENGKELNKELQNTETIKEAIDKIVHVGTKESKKTPSQGNIKSSNEFYVNATAYSANCNGCSGITATGINLISNPNVKVIAVDPSIIPLGTKVWVEGYGYATAADTGGAIKGNRIDIFMPSKSQANNYGVKKVKIRIL